MPDLSSAVDFFASHLGARLAWQAGPFADEGTWMQDAFAVHRSATCSIAMLHLGPTMSLKLSEYTAPDQREEGPRTATSEARTW